MCGTGLTLDDQLSTTGFESSSHTLSLSLLGVEDGGWRGGGKSGGREGKYHIVLRGGEGWGKCHTRLCWSFRLITVSLFYIPWILEL